MRTERVALEKAAAGLAEWLAACRAAERESKRVKAGPALERLFDLVAASEWLPVVAPSGRVGADFVARCRRVAQRWSAALRIEAAALRIGAALDRRAGSSVPAEEALILEEVDARLSARERARLRTLARGYAGEPEEGLRAGEISIPGTRVVAGKGARLVERAMIPGSRIGFGPAFGGGSKRLEAAARAKLGKALALLDAAWPEGGREVRRRTRLVLTLEEPGLVSYSHLHRPGVSYINVRAKTVFDLADDLLHETAHHRLHAVEDRQPLLRVGAGDEVRYWSAWRRALRPVRGILHAAYTFSFRAELLLRMRAAARRGRGRIGPARVSESRRAWLIREAAAERRHLRRSLADLRDAARKGLLSARGRRLVAEIAACRTS